MPTKTNVRAMTCTPFHKDHRDGVLDYSTKRVNFRASIAYNPYLGTTWVSTEEISAFPMAKSTEIYETPQD